MSTWLYHFWLFSFKTAKHWGRGPQTWTAEIIDLDTFRPEKPIIVSSPAASTSQNIPRSINMIDSAFSEYMTFPTPLCRWSIHCPVMNYEQVVSPPPSPPARFDLDDEANWPAWPASSTDRDVTQRLIEGLTRNTFSNVKPSELPITTNQIVKAVQRSPGELHQEALGFSIMSRNYDLVQDLLEKPNDFDYKVNGLWPFHLAAAYLDGSKVCCNILNELVLRLPVRQYYVNDLGHTVLDQLMITILKSHTSCTSNVADSSFKNEERFEGAEVDVCGRWDADSACVRELLRKGNPNIPFDWKHMFCHTSIQAICHCIEVTVPIVLINKPSGLFIRTCYHCGLKLQLFPLHCLVMIGFHLSESGCKDENLFGILACLLSLLSNGVDPRLKADISLESLWGDQDGGVCSHEELDPIELVEKLMARFTSTWSKEIAAAWNVIIYVMRQSRAEWNGDSSPNTTGTPHEVDGPITYSNDEQASDAEDSIDRTLPIYCECFEDTYNYFGRQRSLATLWAAVQTELLTYRRLAEDHAWHSQNFDMLYLSDGLNQGGKVTIPLVEKAMMKPYCECGRFMKRHHPYFATTKEACAFYFSNIEPAEQGC
ncbi:MAG: hypothetical protein Q9195_002330 [Heterodermia aff. obscurata]